MALEASTPLQKRLARAPRWLPADIAAIFKERPTDALQFLADLAEGRSLVGSKKAYECLEPLLFDLVDRPREIDIEPLVPLLRQLCAFATYNPCGLRQYELVRNHATRLAVRGQAPIVPIGTIGD